jgi:hypothetical protein
LETPIRRVETAGVMNSKMIQYMINLCGYMHSLVSLIKGEAGNGREAINLAAVGLNTSSLSHWSGPTVGHAAPPSQPLHPTTSWAGQIWGRNVGADTSMKDQAA